MHALSLQTCGYTEYEIRRPVEGKGTCSSGLGIYRSAPPSALPLASVPSESEASIHQRLSKPYLDGTIPAIKQRTTNAKGPFYNFGGPLYPNRLDCRCIVQGISSLFQRYWARWMRRRIRRGGLHVWVPSTGSFGYKS